MMWLAIAVLVVAAVLWAMGPTLVVKPCPNCGERRNKYVVHKCLRPK